MNDLYAKVLSDVVSRTIANAEIDFCGKSDLQKAKLAAWTAAARKCDGKNPDGLLDIRNRSISNLATIRKQHEDGMLRYRQLAAASANAACIDWVCGCMTAFLLVNGRDPIRTPVRPSEALEVLAIVQHHVCSEKKS